MTKPLTKTQFIAALMDEAGLDRKTAAASLEALAAVTTRTIADGGALTIPGIGKIGVRVRPERQVRNPATGETMTKSADKAVKVTVSKTLKDAVNG